MATYSDPVVSISKGSFPYTVPAGKYARVTVYPDAAGFELFFNGTQCTIFTSSSPPLVPFEVIASSGDTLSETGAGAGSYVALEFSNPL